MQRSSKFLLLASALFGSVTCVRQAEAAPLYSADDAWMRQQIEPTTQTLPLKEALFSLAQTAGANILADATRLPTVQVKPYGERTLLATEYNVGGRANVIGNFCFEAGLNYIRSTPNTLVFWSQPDDEKLVELIIATREQWQIEHPPADRNFITQQLNQFFQRTANWSPEPQTLEEKTLNAQGISATWKLEDFPAELRPALRDELTRQILSWGADYHEFNLGYWRKARATLQPYNLDVVDDQGSVVGRQAVLSLILYPQNANHGVSMGIPSLEPVGKFVSKQQMLAKNRAEFKNSLVPPEELLPSPPDASLPNPDADLSLEREAILSKVVTFAVDQMPLTDFVAELQKQTGVSLSVAPDMLPNLKVTAITGESVAADADVNSATMLSLGAAMESLGHLFAGHWNKTGADYVLHSDNLSELQLGLRQMGNKAFYGWEKQTQEESKQRGNALANETLDAVDFNQLMSKLGASFDEFPAEVQTNFLASLRASRTSDLITSQQRLEDVLNQELRFKFAPLEPTAPRFFGLFRTQVISSWPSVVSGEAGLGAYTADGRFIARLFPFFAAAPVTESEQAQQAYWKDADVWRAKQGLPPMEHQWPPKSDQPDQ